MAEAFSFSRQFQTTPFEQIINHLAECHCRPPGHAQPRYVLLTPEETQQGQWLCPHS